MVWYNTVGVSFTDEDEKLKKQLLPLCIDCADIGGFFNDIDYSDFDGDYDDEDDENTDNKFEKDYLTIGVFLDDVYEALDVFLLFNLLFPNTFFYATSEHEITNREYADNVTEKMIKEAIEGGYENSLSGSEEGEFILWFCIPDNMMIETYTVETNEYIECDGSSNGCDTFISDEPTTEPIKCTVPDKEFIRSVIEESTEKGYTELTALLLDKCKDILTSDDPLEDISFDDEDDDKDEDDE